MIFCNDLKLSISSKTLDMLTIKKTKSIEMVKIFVKFDHKEKLDQADNIIYLCKSFKRPYITIVKAIFNAKHINLIKQTGVQFKIINHTKISKNNGENSLVNNGYQKSILTKMKILKATNNFIKNKKSSASDITDKTRNNFSASIQNKQIDDKNKEKKNTNQMNQTKKFDSSGLEQIIPKKEVNVRKYF